MEMTSRPGERRFYAELLTLLGAPQRPRADIAQMEQAALRIIEAISGDVQLARRFQQFTLSRWAANDQFETLVVSILRNTPLRNPSVLIAKSLRRILQITEGITANIFYMINSLAIDAIENGHESITDEAIESWEPDFDTEAAYA